MKNVKKLLIFATISTFVFASWTRTNALGGNAGYWADDYANVSSFPADVNNHNVAYTNGADFTSIFNSDGTTWGFSGGTGDDVANVMWGNGTMGASFSLARTPDNDDTDADESNNAINAGFGMPLAGMDFGATYASGGTIGINLRRAQDVWVWDNMLINFSNTSDDSDTETNEADMSLGISCYSNTTYDSGTSSLFALGFDYGKMGDDDATMGITWTFAVESAMTDWATLRVGYTHGYDFSSGGTDVAASDDTMACDADGAAHDTAGLACGDAVDQVGGLTLGLGFNYGSFALDMSVGSGAMFNNPVHYITGRNTDDLGANWTISYNW